MKATGSACERNAQHNAVDSNVPGESGKVKTMEVLDGIFLFKKRTTSLRASKRNRVKLVSSSSIPFPS
jgi:hypothetical protein